MKNKFLLYVVSSLLLMSMLSLSACYEKYEPTFDNIPISFKTN